MCGPVQKTPPMGRYARKQPRLAILPAFPYQTEKPLNLMRTPHQSKCLRRERFKLLLGMVWLAALAPLPTARADVFNDDLCHGIDTAYWVVESNQPLYTVEATTGGVRFSKPAGGTYSFQHVTLESQVVARGNFDVRVDYTNASISRIDGSPGNQVQLNSLFGGQYLIVVRSDEINYGQNIHVWANPPSAWFGQRACTDTSGTMRITRTNAHLRAYHNATLIYENDYNTNDASFAMPLQNNGTRDATAVSEHLTF